MKCKISLAVAALFLIIPAAADGQSQSVRQSGAVTSGHATSWTTNGVVQDAGTVSTPNVNALGLYNGSNCPLGISSQTTPGATASAHSQFSVCQTDDSSTLRFEGVGRSAPNVYFDVGGTTYPFPGTVVSPWVIDGSNIYNYNSGNVGIGTSSPTQKGEIKGCLGLDGSSSGQVAVCPQSAAGTYNLNLPDTAGSAGQSLISGGGSAAAMDWETQAASAADISALQAITNPYSGKQVVVSGRRGGIFVWVSGSLPCNPVTGGGDGGTTFCTSDGSGGYLTTGYWQRQSPTGYVTPEWFGAVGDGSTDDSAAIQKAVDGVKAQGGGTVQFAAKTYRANFTTDCGVSLNGAGTYFGYNGSNPQPVTTIEAYATGNVIDTPSTGGSATCFGVSITNLNVLGLGSSIPVVGIYLRNTLRWCNVSGVNIQNTADQGLYANVQACNFSDLLVVNGLLDQDRSAIAGAVEIHGLDNFGMNIESGCGQTTSFSTNYTLSGTPIFTAGIWIDSAADDQFTVLLPEACDTGLYSTTANSSYVNLKPSYIVGHAIIDNGSGGTLYTNTYAASWGSNAADTYDAFYKMAGSQDVHMVNFNAYVPGGWNNGRYAINDQTADTGAFHSSYSNITTAGTFTSTYNITAAYLGPAFGFNSGPPKALTTNSTTPSVDNYTNWRTNNSSLTSITNFLNGVSGQSITIKIEDAYTQIPSGASITTSGATTISAQGIYTFLLWNGVWYQTSGTAF